MTIIQAFGFQFANEGAARSSATTGTDRKQDTTPGTQPSSDRSSGEVASDERDRLTINVGALKQFSEAIGDYDPETATDADKAQILERLKASGISTPGSVIDIEI